MTRVHYASFLDLKYKPKESDLICQFKIIPAKGYSFREVCSITAGESSVGTWTDLTTVNERMQKRIAPKVYWIDPRSHRCRIAYPVDLFELGNVSDIMSSIGGNIYGMKCVDGLLWEDVKLPKKIIKSFDGPRFGIRGIRSYLRVFKRPLVGTIVKPKVGLNEEEHARVAYEAWLGGCDIVKDDENLTSQSFNNFYVRVKKTLKRLREAERKTGEKKVYLANCTAPADEMVKRIKFVERCGGNYIMLDILTLGWSALQYARKVTKLPIHAHRAGHAMFDRSPNHGMKMEVVAQFARMVGVDTLHIGTAYGKMAGGREEVLHIEKEIEGQFTKQTQRYLSQKWYNVKPVLGVASGGVHPGIVPKIISLMGNDVVIQAGGGVHGHPDGTVSGARAMRQAVEAAMKKKNIKEFARSHVELKKAIEKWGL
ncbi:type III ribulose-bisphosphate carboxylase [Candidatus Pacearchaeota archaeon]|nr:MAG: type III ribulose-bisphosphate carboxylase [Candidatus Pacearchaeota archaeon]